MFFALDWAERNRRIYKKKLDAEGRNRPLSKTAEMSREEVEKCIKK